MNRWLCLSAAAMALVLAGCNDDDKSSESPGPARAAERPGSMALGYAGSPDLMPRAQETARALTGAAAERGDDAGRRLFDGAARRAGFGGLDESGTVYAPASSGARSTLARYSGQPRRISDLGRELPPVTGLKEGVSLPDAIAGKGSVLAQFEAFTEACFRDPSSVLSRAGWGAAKRRGSPVAMAPTHVTVHHTQGPQTMDAATTAQVVRNIQHFHMANTDGKHGWDDIGYHFLIDGAGRVVEGRPAETLGAHAGGANDQNIGISMMGDFNKVRPTDAQVESLTRLISFLALKYGQNPSRAGFLEPHRHYDQTDCPGHNMMAILDALRQRVNAQTGELQARLGNAKPGEFVPVMATDA